MPTSSTPKPSLSRAYTLKASKIPDYFRVLLENPIPEVFDTAYLAKSGFRYAIDRAFIDILKGLGFLNDAGNPTRRYRDFCDHRQAATALRQGLIEAYAGLLAAMPDAAARPEREIMKAVSQYFEGEINDMAASGIAATFLALTRFAASLDNGSASADAADIVGAVQRSAAAALAEFEPPSPSPDASGASAAAAWTAAPEAAPTPVVAATETSMPEATAVATPSPNFAEAAPTPSPVPPAAPMLEVTAPEPAAAVPPETAPDAAAPEASRAAPKTTDHTEDAPGIIIEACSFEARNQTQGTPQRPIIHITLPASTDQAVYDAIFASLKRQLLSPGDNA